jgi:CRP/FNR family transcriptional regulator
MVTIEPALSAAEAKVLRALGRWPGDRLPPTLRELASALGWRTAAAVREYLGRLQAKGLVQLEPGRARAIRLTEAGQALVQDRLARGRQPVLPPDGLDGPLAVMRLLEAGARSQALRKGSLLWQEGEPADRLVRVEHGLLRAFRTFDDGRTATLLRFGPGDVLGFSPFFEGAGYPASVEAVAPSRVQVVHRQDLEVALKDPCISRALLALLARRLSTAFDTIEQLSIRSAVNRVASALEPLVPGGPYPIVAIPGTARSFAEAIGLTPASLSRALATLVLKGVLHRLGPGKYQVVRLEALRHLAAGVDSDRT